MVKKRTILESRNPPAPPEHGYPRPQLERDGWISLNGPWQFALDPEARWRTPVQVAWDATILVPFSPETLLSGIGDTGFYRRCWYRESLRGPAARLGRAPAAPLRRGRLRGDGLGQRLAGRPPRGRLHAVHIDITDLLRPLPRGRPGRRSSCAPTTIPHDLAKPRGKQDWQLEPHSIWYPRTTGIWQTVWLERVPATWIGSIRWTPSLERWEIGFEACAGRRAARTAAAGRASSGPATSSWPTTPTRSSPARSIAGSRSPTRGSTTSATSCSGAPRARR